MNFLKIIIIFLFCFAFSINLDGTTEIAKKNEIYLIIEKIPSKDLSSIKNLFEYLFIHNELSYSLFGDKPVSFCNSVLSQPPPKLSRNLKLTTYCALTFTTQHKLLSNWYVWKKYKDSFPIKNFKFFECQSTIFIINKISLHNLFKNELVSNLFSKQLGPKWHKKYIENGINCEADFFSLLNHDHHLIGVLLGYGYNNSLLFKRRHVLCELIESENFSLFNPRFDSINRHETIQKELEDLEKRLEPLNENSHLFPLVNDTSLVNFIIDNKLDESKKLKKRYLSQMKKNRSILYREDWFESILIELCK